jgi:hypothetical protein
MGETLGTQYTALFQEFGSLNLYWKEFLELFGTNDKRITRMNQSAPGFFQMLQEQQFETNMSHLARLTDSSKSVGKDNLTVRNLPDLVTDPGLKAELDRHVEDIKRKTEFCRDWRTGASLIMTCCWQRKTAEPSRLNPPPRKRSWLPSRPSRTC